MTDLRTPASEPGLREQATIRLRKKRDFRAHLLAYVLFNGALVIIWALTGASFFWPAIPMLIWGIGLGVPRLGHLPAAVQRAADPAGVEADALAGRTRRAATRRPRCRRVRPSGPRAKEGS